MNWLLPEGASLVFEGLDQPLHIRQGLGGGSQGQVFAVELQGRDQGETLALKWYFPSCIRRDPQLRARLKQSIRLGAPNGDFLWPLALLEPPPASSVSSFGYLMPLRAEGFVGAHLHAGGSLEISLQNVLKACFRLADGFHQLHLKGLCYKDISLGNLFLEPVGGRILICDNDNVDIDGQGQGSVLGTPGFMAPEVLLGQARPSAGSDLFSLAVLIFRLLTRHDPYRGKLELQFRCLDIPAKRRLYAEEPVFIFATDDARNRPDPVEHPAPLVTWPIYPAHLQQIFQQSLGAGARDPSQRAYTGQWMKVLARVLDQRRLCPHCGQEVFPEPGAASRCWDCAGELAPARRLRSVNGVVALAAENELYRHHLDALAPEGLDQPLARIESHPHKPGLLGILNLSDQVWMAEFNESQRLPVPPGKRCNVENLRRLDTHIGSLTVES